MNMLVHRKIENTVASKLRYNGFFKSGTFIYADIKSTRYSAVQEHMFTKMQLDGTIVATHFFEL